MTLPDASRLARVPRQTWEAFARRLATVGYLDEATWAIHRLAAEARSPLHAPIAKWHARRVREPWGNALRLFLLNDPVPELDARAVLGPDLPLELWLDAGLLERHAGDQVSSPYLLEVSGGCLFLCDDLIAGGDAVMGPARTTHDLVRTAYPAGRLGTALDLGCGPATAAILLAPRCDRVVATDVNPRAITLARVNTWMNAVGNVELRRGDLFEPVAGETFDLVVSQPPFVAQPDGTPGATYLHGGARGDELPMRLLGELAKHLAPGGLAVLFVEWPIIEGDPPIETRIREALAAPGASLLVVGMTEVDFLDQHCEHYATQTRPTLDAEWERLVLERRDHFERMRVRQLRPSFNVVRTAAAGTSPWTSVVRSRSFVQARLTRARLDALIAARDLEASGTAALCKARLTVPADVSFAEHEGRYRATFGEDALSDPVDLEGPSLVLLKAVRDADTVARAVDWFAGTPWARGATPESIVAEIRAALLGGLLEVAPGAASGH